MIDSLTRGGAESSLAAMAPGLVDRGVRLDVVTLKSRPALRDQILAAGATVTDLQGSRATWWRQVRRLVRDRSPDLVHTTLFEADLAGRVGARLGGVPVVSTLATEGYGPAHRAEYPHRRVRLLGAQLIDATTARLTVRLHAVSWAVAEVMSRRLCYPRKRIHVIPRGRDPEVLGRRTPERRDAARAGLGVGPDDRVVLAVARHEPHKGLVDLIDALPGIRAALPTAQVVVAGGQGSATEDLVRRAEAAGITDRFRLLGPRADVAELFCAADVFTLPSRREGLPGALLEAMALECPAVVSDIPPVREVADESTARFAAPGDTAGLARAVVETLTDAPGTHARTAVAHRRFLDGYTIDAAVDRMIRFYRGALAEG